MYNNSKEMKANHFVFVNSMQTKSAQPTSLSRGSNRLKASGVTVAVDVNH